MKIDKEQEKELRGIPAWQNTFSKVHDLKVPDSPPPEEDKEDEEDLKKPNKFEFLMNAACSIKQKEMESKRLKFERLPAFLKAGVYYSTKLEATRK